MIILIDNYDSFTFNLVHYLGGLGADVVVHRNDKISVAEVMTSEPDSIVLSPGPLHPERGRQSTPTLTQISASSGNANFTSSQPMYANYFD